MVNDEASSLCIEKVTEGMVYTIKYEPKMMLTDGQNYSSHWVNRHFYSYCNTQCELAKSSDVNKSNIFDLLSLAMSLHCATKRHGQTTIYLSA